MLITKISAILLMLIAFVGILSLANSLSANFAVISNTGEVSTTKTMARSGSPSDIQAAVNAAAAAGGGAVYIPAGTFNWNNQTVTIPGGVSVFGASNAGTDGHPNFNNYTAQTILHNVAAVAGHYGINDMFVINGQTDHRAVRISGIRFESNVTGVNPSGPQGQDSFNQGAAIRIRYPIVDFRIDHNTFINFAYASIYVNEPYGGTTRGVIDHNYIDNPYKDYWAMWITWWAYGVLIQGGLPTWDSNIDHFLGKYETVPATVPAVYIEDNHISRARHAISTGQEAWYVARFNIVTNERPYNFQAIDVHGAGGGSNPGGRGLEAYNNTISGTTKAFGIRGGGGVIYNNTVISVSKLVTLWNESGPSYSQVQDLYIWGNTGLYTTLVDPTGEGTNSVPYVQNQDYFLYAKVSYVAYPYPHPLILSP